MSLWRLLRQQHGTNPSWVTHEAKPHLPWQPPANSSAAVEASARIALLAARLTQPAAVPPGDDIRVLQPDAPSDSRRFVGDVASSYLPYGQALLEAEPCAVLLILERNKDDVLRSWQAKSAGADFWRAPLRTPEETLAALVALSGNDTAAARTARAEAYWGPLFPKFGRDVAPTKDAAIARYWEDYKAKADLLAAAYPSRARVFPSPAVFEDATAQRALLHFAGFATPRMRPGHRYNCQASCPPQAPSVAAMIAAHNLTIVQGG